MRTTEGKAAFFKSYEFREAIRDYMHLNKVRRIDVSRDAGVHEAILRRLENGFDCNLDNFMAICYTCKLNPNDYMALSKSEDV